VLGISHWMMHQHRSGRLRLTRYTGPGGPVPERWKSRVWRAAQCPWIRGQAGPMASPDHTYRWAVRPWGGRGHILMARTPDFNGKMGVLGHQTVSNLENQGLNRKSGSVLLFPETEWVRNPRKHPPGPLFLFGLFHKYSIFCALERVTRPICATGL